MHQYPRLFNLTFSKNITVAKVFVEGFGCIRFRRLLWGETLSMWVQLQQRCSIVQLTNHQDKLLWNLGSKMVFTLHSFYSALKMQETPPHTNSCGRLNCLLNWKFFFGWSWKTTFLPKSIWREGGWHSPQNCQFCGMLESIDNLFFRCPLARFFWTVAACAFNFKP